MAAGDAFPEYVTFALAPVHTVVLAENVEVAAFTIAIDAVAVFVQPLSEVLRVIVDAPVEE